MKKEYLNVKNFILSNEHKKYRKKVDDNLAELYSSLNLSPIERMTRRFEYLTSIEKPFVLKDESISFLRTVSNLPAIFTEKEWNDIRDKHYIHELGFHSNITPNYEKIIKNGLLYYYDNCNEYAKRDINALLSLCDRYSDEALKVGNIEVSANLKRVPRFGAENFTQALQSFRVIHYALWLEGNYHITVGTFDRYMYPYYKRDIENGVLTKEKAQELVEEFFLSFNRDNDLYPGVQQGDNGQSLVLGGLDENGIDQFNELSELCLIASGNLMLIDPKINIRVNKNTPIRTYELGTELTKKGMGFPQYTNDDIAIPALESLGYSHADASSYSMAACWELIIPNVGMDIANIDALSFNKVVDICFRNYLEKSNTMEEFLKYIKKEIKNECERIASNKKNVWFIPSPLLYLCMDLDENNKAKYNNFGIHGTGITNASDSLYAIEKYVFNEKSISCYDFIKSVDEDFKDSPELLHKLRYNTEKVGQNNDNVDKYLVMLLKEFSDSLKNLRNEFGGSYRAGTGSAMYYLWHSDELGSSPDGRKRGEPFGTNFSISLFAKTDGPFSVINSLTKPDFYHAMNGGPVTLEFSSSIWNAEDSTKKFSLFVKTFFNMGGHQLQLNSVNLETLKDAQKHPEKYERLIVRIWGWSAYFTCLDKRYQDHVIKRQEYNI